MTVTNGDTMHVRLAFEAYAQMGSKLHLCRNHFEVNALLKEHLKYLFDFTEIRISYVQNSQVICHAINKAQADVSIGDKDILTPLETKILVSQKPEINKTTGSDYIRGWYFKNAESGILLLSVCNSNKEGVVMSRATLLLLSESLLAKFLQFNLYDQLDKQNDEISKALAIVTLQNQEIQALVEEQKEEIALQTKNIRNKNKQLRKIAKLNAHEVREPLTRILALTQLLKLNKSLATYQELSFIEEASAELDAALRHTITKAEIELKS